MICQHFLFPDPYHGWSPDLVPFHRLLNSDHKSQEKYISDVSVQFQRGQGEGQGRRQVRVCKLLLLIDERTFLCIFIAKLSLPNFYRRLNSKLSSFQKTSLKIELRKFITHILIMAYSNANHLSTEGYYMSKK